MKKNNWDLKQTIDAVIFDCDGTLSSIEGIDEIAKQNGVGERVAALTETAMAKTGLTSDLYAKRLELVKPNQAQLQTLAQHYLMSQTPLAGDVIRILQQLGKAIYITSAGLYPAVSDFGVALGIPPANIFAVAVHFDATGNFVDYDRNSPFTNNQGKHDIVAQIKQHHPQLVYVGDGMNDLAVKNLVTRFIGYGGFYFRENIAAQSDFYIKTPSLAALLPLCLTTEEQNALPLTMKSLLNKGIDDLETDKVMAKIT